jgi:hypothetical protein
MEFEYVNGAIAINGNAFTDEDKAIECVKKFFHPFPSFGDTIFWVTSGGRVRKGEFLDNNFFKSLKNIGNYYKTSKEAEDMAEKMKELFKK